MDLADIQSLPIDDKSQWLQSSVGLAHLQSWLSEGISLRQIAQMMNISSRTLNRWRKYPDIAVIIGYPKPEPKLPMPDLSRPIDYRIVGLDRNQRAIILTEHAYETAEEVWESNFIRSYFASYGRSELDYLVDYLAEIRRTGVYRLSNSFCITYGSINKRGILKPLKPPVREGIANV